MNPGRELDVLIAEKVFGTKVEFLNQSYGWRIDYVADAQTCNDPIDAAGMVDGWRLKRYSTDIAAAWQAVEKLKTEFPELEITYVAHTGETHAQFIGGPDNDTADHTHYRYYAKGSSAAHAICLAALKATQARSTIQS